jgi:hypothetical protein
VDVILSKMNMKHKVVRVAALMAYFLLLRQSEYIFKVTESNHALKVCNIEFMHAVRKTFVRSNEVSNWMYSEVESVRVTLPHCKNDPFRRGNQFWYEAHKASEGEFDIVEEMFQWAKVANSQADDVFTSFRNEVGVIYRLTYYTIT